MNINRVYIVFFLTLAFFIIVPLPLLSQSQWDYPQKKDVTSVVYAPFKKHEGLTISLSLVAMFTTGAADRNGFRLGAGINVSQTINNWTFTTGLDSYKAKQKYGLGMTYAGVSFDDLKYGGSYYLTKYWQGDKQLSGILGLHLDQVRIRFEDDILALPFSGFVLYDRYRTAALELDYRGVLLGTNVYSNEPDGLLEECASNSRGIYHTGKQMSSPLYIGYTNRNIVFRYGLNNRLGGYLGQNGWHETLFSTSNFKWGGQNNQFLQLGFNKLYTLY